MKKIDDWKSIDPVVSTGRTPIRCVPSRHVAARLEIFHAKEKKEKSTISFIRSSFYGHDNVKKTQIDLIRTLLFLFFVSRFFLLFQNL